MLKKLGILSATCLALLGCHTVEESKPAPVPAVAFQQPTIKMPKSIIVCRAKQCAPAQETMSKEYIYNTLLHMLDSNARKKALVCAADANTHACTEEYVSMPITVGITPAYLYIDDVKITDVSISRKNTSALDLILNWNISYNGQTPICRPSKTLLYAKNINNVIMEDNGYNCKITTIGTSTVKTLFAIDYIDLDYGYIGGFYSVGLSGPAFGGGSGYMMLRLPEEISMNPKDFQVKKAEPKKAETKEAEVQTAPVPCELPSCPTYQPEYVPCVMPECPTATTTQSYTTEVLQQQPVAAPAKEPAPNVDTIIKYNHASQDYDKAKAAIAKKKKEEAEAVDYEGVKVFPVKHSNLAAKPKSPDDKNELTDYRKYNAKLPLYR